MTVTWFKRRTIANSAPAFTANPAPQTERPPMKPQQLGPNQLRWLEERFMFYGLHRKQAEAPAGVAVGQIPPWQTETHRAS